jgi:multiple sugar transport system ATP-binding protein
MAEVELIGVSKIFDKKVKAVDNVSFKAHNNQLLTLLGPSGCGKTTILRLIAGLEYPDEGEILIDKKRVNDLPPPARDVAMVFQSYALYPHMNVFDNISIGLKLRGVKKDEIKTKTVQTAKLLGIDELLERKPRAISGGQRQRVALARAIIREPKAFLLDEPLSNLDAALRERTRSELKLLFSKIAATVIYVTHDQVEAMTLSDRVVVLNEGKVQQIGTPQQIYNYPSNTFVATFVGSPRMNIIEGKIQDNKIVCGDIIIELGTKAKIDTGREIIVGIRPEDISLVKLPHKDALKIKVVLHEPLGSHTIVVFKTQTQELKAVVPSTFDISEVEYGMVVNSQKVHIFDKDSGQRIWQESSSSAHL